MVDTTLCDILVNLVFSFRVLHTDKQTDVIRINWWVVSCILVY